MYCPVCFNSGLALNSRGLIKLSFNGKQKDTSRTLYNIQKESTDEIKKNIKDKIEEFFKWYSTLQNKDPMKEIEIYTIDFTCPSKCNIPLSSKISVIGTIISQKEVIAMATELGAKYNIPVALKF